MTAETRAMARVAMGNARAGGVGAVVSDSVTTEAGTVGEAGPKTSLQIPVSRGRIA